MNLSDILSVIIGVIITFGLAYLIHGDDKNFKEHPKDWWKY